jgi:uncharacterized protein YbbK (DUF523 family)/uncharacterized protein YbgA (DUF1722 family)
MRKNQGARRLRVGVSACLLGEEVRYDGGHKRDPFLTDMLGHYVEWVPVCPEVEMGLRTPRPAMRLVRIGDAVGDIRMMAPETGADHTDAMRAWSNRRVEKLGAERLAGYILKKDSPSCGMERVKLYPAEEGGVPVKEGRGLFAEVLLRRYPDLPVEEEGRLHDPLLRENFVTRIFVRDRWMLEQEEGWTRSFLMRFHERHKFLFMARSQAGMHRLGRLLGESGKDDRPDDLAAAYLDGMTEILRRAPTRQGHTNVLYHLAGFVTNRIDGGDRRELIESIERYHAALLPLIVPVTLLRHHVRRLGLEYLQDQVYLEPHPQELMLLNHV